MTAEFLIDAKSGDRRSLARTLSAIENRSLQLEDALDVLGPVPSLPEDDWQTLAITGAPGVGKSCLLIAIHGYTPKQLQFGTGGPPYVENMYTKESFNSVFHDCNTLVSEEYEAEQKSGSAHVGMSALVDFIARKPI